MLDKLSGTYAPRPSNGPHKLREALPLVVSIDSTRQIQQHPAYPSAMRDKIIANWT
jgi:ribosomal protein S4E